MKAYEIGCIGVGNMATAILRGVLEAGKIAPQAVTLYDISPAQLLPFIERGCTAAESIPALVAESAMVILAIKPQQFPQVLPLVAKGITADTVVVSIAAGITSQHIKEAMGFDCKVVLAMPNTPLLLGTGATVLAKVAPTTQQEFENAKALFESAGIVEEIPEGLINSSMPVHGSSPAFIYQFAKGLIENAVGVGFTEEVAMRLVAQTLIGSGEMLRSAGKTPQELIDMVCSPGGATLAGMAALEKSGFDQAVENAFSATIWRGREMAGGVHCPDGLKVEVITYGSPAYEQAKALRYIVMRKPIGMELTKDELETDKTATHFAAFLNGAVVGTAQMFPRDVFSAKIGRVAVASEVQKKGVGAMLMQYVEQYAKEKGFSRLTLNARLTAKSFYMRLGYLSRGAIFMERGMPHMAMYKEIDESVN